MAFSYRSAFLEARHTSSPTSSSFPPLPSCPRCRGVSHHSTGLRNSFDAADISTGLLGLVSLLPPETLVDSKSCAYAQDHVNAGAFNHPAVILAQSECKHLVFCAPCTSFDGQSIMQKYERASEWFRQENALWQYLVLGEGESFNGLGSFEYEGAKLPRRTYMNLAMGFWIEYENLAHASKDRRRLTRGALDRAQWAYGVAESYRRANGIPEGMAYAGKLQPSRSRSPPTLRETAAPKPWRPTSAGGWRASSVSQPMQASMPSCQSRGRALQSSNWRQKAAT